jgi:integrase
MAFLVELEERVGSVTRYTYVSRLCRMATILAPDRDFGWLRQIEASLKLLMRPRSRANRIVDQSRLWVLGLALMERAEVSPDLTQLRRARLYREGLMIAFLAACPIRLKNFASLEIDRHIRKYGSEWWLILDASETKSGRPDERPLPELATHIERWLNHWRPLFKYPGSAFWPSIKGGRLAYTFVGSIISNVTLRELGVDVSPHLFRHSAIHTIASRSGEHIELGSAVLQHTDPRTTAIYNTKAKSIQAGRALQTIISALQD